MNLRNLEQHHPNSWFCSGLLARCFPKISLWQYTKMPHEFRKWLATPISTPIQKWIILPSDPNNHWSDHFLPGTNFLGTSQKTFRHFSSASNTAWAFLNFWGASFKDVFFNPSLGVMMIKYDFDQKNKRILFLVGWKSPAARIILCFVWSVSDQVALDDKKASSLTCHIFEKFRPNFPFSESWEKYFVL